MAAFVVRASDRDLAASSRLALKARILDSLGCAFGALDAQPIARVRRYIESFGGSPLCTLVGGGRNAPDRAAFYNGALVRYLDFNDSYLAPNETCHPSDNLAAVLAACEFAGATGRGLLAALAVAYQVQCRLSDKAPVRDRGFDHVTQGAAAVAAGVAKALDLDEERTANAIAMAVTGLNALRVTRTGSISHWKGLAYAHMSHAATQAAFLAAQGITGPPEAFEGNKGWMQTISGPFEIDWRYEDLERVTRTAIKRYDAEIHAQSAIESLLELRAEHGFQAGEIQRIEVDIFDVAYRIIGGGEEGDKTIVQTREQADHSLPYMLAAAACDGEMGPAQYETDRIVKSDVQSLLRNVVVRPDEALSARFPEECPCRLRVFLHDGRVLARERSDYLGYPSRPMSFSDVETKFVRLTQGVLDSEHQQRLIRAVAEIEELAAADLAEMLSPRPRSVIAAEPLTEDIQP